MAAMLKIEKEAIEKLRSGSLTIAQERTLLKEAALNGWANLLKEACRVHADGDLPVAKNRLLRMACVNERGNADAAKVLLTAGADPNSRDVMAQCSLSTLPFLVKAGGNVDGRDGEESPLITAIVTRTKQDKALALIKFGADVNVADENGVTAAMHAAALGRNKVFDALVAAGADLYAVDHSGRSVARHVAESFTGGTHRSTASDLRNASRIARQLKKLLPAQPEDELVLTIALGEAEELRRMVKSGLDPNTMIVGSLGTVGLSKDDLRRKLRQKAKEHGGLFGALLAEDELFPSTAKRDDEMGGMSLLMWATAVGQVECVRVLLEHGVNPKLRNRGGLTALAIAKAQDNPTLARLLAGYQEATKAKKKGAVERCHLLGLSKSDVQKLLKEWGNPGNYDSAGRNWSIACLQFLNGDDAGVRKSLSSVLRLAKDRLFDPSLDEKVMGAKARHLKARLYYWDRDFTQALAAAGALGQRADVEKLKAFPTKGCYRGEKNPKWDLDWYEWPLWLHLGGLARGERPDPKLLKEMRSQSTARSKAVLAAFEAIQSRNSLEAQKAIDGIVQAEIAWQKEKWQAIQPTMCISPQATFFYHLARHQKLDIDLSETWIAHVLPELH